MQPLPKPRPIQITELSNESESKEKKLSSATKVRRNETDGAAVKKEDYNYLGYLNLYITDIRDESGTIMEFEMLEDLDDEEFIQDYLIDFFSEMMKEVIVSTLSNDNPSLEFEIEFISIKPGSLDVKAKIYSKLKYSIAGFTLSSALWFFIEPIVDEAKAEYGKAGYALVKELGATVVSKSFLQHPTCYITSSKQEIDCASKETDLKPGIYIFSAPGDTFSNMASQAIKILDFGDISLNQMMMVMYQINLNRFNGSIHRLQANVGLLLPTKEEMNKFTKEEADEFILNQPR